MKFVRKARLEAGIAAFLMLLGPAMPQAKEAAFNAYCLSASLSKGSAFLPGLLLEAYFTTYDGSTALPLHDQFGNLFIFSSELSPNPSVPGNYRTDYMLFANGAVDSSGTSALTFPTADTDGNGVQDFLEVRRSGTVAFSGTVTREFPSTAPASTITGQITRAAGSVSGSYTVNTQNAQVGVITYSGTTSILNATGALTYDRNPNNAVIDVAISSADGTSTTFSGNAGFAVVDANNISFPAISFSGSNARVIQAKAFTLTRSGKRYLGNLEFQDAGLGTSWRDYVSWRIEITDSNDSDGDGIPDLSDNLVVAPTITAQPQSVTVTAGQAAQFSVTAIGTAPLGYQWQRNGQDIPFATRPSYTIGNVQSGDAGEYRVIVSNGANSVPSEVAKLTVNPAVVSPTITAQPQSVTVTVGQAAQFSVTAAGTPPFAYQWRKDGVDLPLATNAVLKITNTSLPNTGSYLVVVRNSVGQTTSDAAILAVNPASIELRITRLQVLATAEVDVDVNVAAGHSYVLEATSDFKAWTPAKVFSASQSLMTIRVSIADTRMKFFRVR